MALVTPISVAGRSVRGLLRSPLRPQHWAWALPPAIAVVVLQVSASRLQLLIGGLIAAGVVILVARAPAAGLLSLVALLPFQEAILAFLYRSGAPSGAVRALGGWKEAVVAGLVLAGLKGFRTSGRRLDALDFVALAYIAVATAYLAAPGLFVRGSVGAPPSLSVRLLAWRVDTLFVFALLAARHSLIGMAVRRRFIKVGLAAGAVVAGIGCFEALDTSTWNNFAVNTLGVPRYQAAVLHTTYFPLGMNSVEMKQTVAGHLFTRVGSVFFSPLTFGFYLVLVLGVGIAAASRGRTRPLHLAIALAAGALLATITRSAILSGAIVLILGLLPDNTLRSNWQRSRKVRFAMVALVGLIALAPLVVTTGVSHRSSAALSGGADATDHVSSTTRGLQSLVAHPLGLGIGTAPGVGNRFNVSGQLTAEDAYLQVGDELGVAELVLFVALLFLVVRRLGRAQTADDDSAPLARGLRLAALALVVGGFFLHVWLDFSLAISLWGGAGLAIGTAERLRPKAREPSAAVPTISEAR
jgi:hypothetical protein